MEKVVFTLLLPLMWASIARPPPCSNLLPLAGWNHFPLRYRLVASMVVQCCPFSGPQKSQTRRPYYFVICNCHWGSNSVKRTWLQRYWIWFDSLSARKKLVIISSYANAAFTLYINSRMRIFTNEGILACYMGSTCNMNSTLSVMNNWITNITFGSTSNIYTMAFTGNGALFKVCGTTFYVQGIHIRKPRMTNGNVSYSY